MKTTPILIIVIIFLLGGILLLNPPLIPTEIPLPSAVLVTPTISVQPSNVQVLKASYGPPKGFYPFEFTVKSGQPVRLEVLATENGRGCMGSIMVPDFLPDDIQFFTKGETAVFEFTPTIPGEYQITCGMGIPHASLVVK